MRHLVAMPMDSVVQLLQYGSALFRQCQRDYRIICAVGEENRNIKILLTSFAFDLSLKLFQEPE